jgi:hypothetical protein
MGGKKKLCISLLRETTSRGLCGLVCPSRTSERGGEGYCVKEGGGEEGERERERGGGYWRTCATRDDEPRPVWTSDYSITHTHSSNRVCLLLQDLLQSCSRCVCVYYSRTVQSCLCLLLQYNVCVCLLLQYLLQSCLRACVCLCVFITAVPITKLFAGGGGGGEWRTCARR